MKVLFHLIRTVFKIHDKLGSINEKLEGMVGRKPASPRLTSEKWLDGQEVMQKLHISERTLLRLRQHKLLPYTRINRKFYYRETDVASLFSSHYQK